MGTRAMQSREKEKEKLKKKRKQQRFKEYKYATASKEEQFSLCDAMRSVNPMLRSFASHKTSSGLTS